MLTKVKEDPKYYSCIYTTEVSRLGRNPIHTRKLIDELTYLEVPIYVQTINRYTYDKVTGHDMIMSIILQVLIEYANYEAETFKTRSRSGLRQSAQKGRAGGSNNLPYGYTKNENKILVVENSEAEVIKNIYTL